MIKLSKEQKEKFKELEKEEELKAGHDDSFDENDEYDNEEEKYDGYDEYNEHYDEPDPYDDYEQELRNNEEDDDESDDHIDDSGFLEEQEAEQKKQEEEWAEDEKYAKEQRASIAFEKEDGSIISSLIGSWGDVSRTLNEEFNDEKSALKLSEIG